MSNMKPEDLKKGAKEARDLIRKGRYREALARLMHLTEKYPDDADIKSGIAAALNQRGVAHAEAGQADRAWNDFQSSLRYRETAEAHVSLGRMHQSRGSYEDAFTEYSRALDLDPELPLAHEYLGYYFLETGDFDQSVTAFGRAIAKGHTNKHIYLGLWEAYMGLERREQAHETIEEMAARAPDDDEVLGTLGLSWAVCRNDPARAEEAWKKAVERNPRNLSALFHLAGLAADRSDRQEAMAYLRRCVAIDPQKTVAMWREDIHAPQKKFAAYQGDEDFLDLLGVFSN